MKKIRMSELAAFDGKDGRPAYIAFDGKVYDVSASWHWKDGKHHVTHRAGEDLTDALDHKVHGADLLDRVPVVGTLAEG